MKVYLVKVTTLQTNKQGMTVIKYGSVMSDLIFTSEKKANNFLKERIGNKNLWEYRMFPYESWTQKEPSYTIGEIKNYTRYELHEIEVN